MNAAAQQQTVPLLSEKLVRLATLAMTLLDHGASDECYRSFWQARLVSDCRMF